MDGYAPAYVAHNIPLLVVSGLGPGREDDVQHKEGTRISSEVPTVESDDALALRRIFKDGDASDLEHQLGGSQAQHRLLRKLSSHHLDCRPFMS